MSWLEQKGTFILHCSDSLRVRLVGFQILPETETVQFLSRNVSLAETETPRNRLAKLSGFRFLKERMVVQLTSVPLCIYVVYLHNKHPFAS